MSARRGTPGPLWLTALALIVAAPAAAQIEITAGGGLAFESYSFDEPASAGIESLSLFTVPFAATAAPLPSLDVTLSGALARGSMTTSTGDDISLTGLTDTGLQASWRLQDRVVVTGTFYVPTGATGLDLDQARVAGAVSSLLLPFRVNNWGLGGGTDISAAYAHRVNEEVGVGVRIGYRMLNEYEPLELDGAATGNYDPGDQIYVRVAADRDFGAAKGTVSLTYQNIGEDASEGQNVFSTGDRIQLLGSYVFPFAGWGSAFAYGGLLYRGEGEFLAQTGLDPSAAQTLFMAGLGARTRIRDILFRPALDVRALRTGDGVSQGYTLGVGGQAEFTAREIVWVPTARLRLGNLTVREGVESPFNGFEFGLTVRKGWTR